MTKPNEKMGISKFISPVRLGWDNKKRVYFPYPIYQP